MNLTAEERAGIIVAGAFTAGVAMTSLAATVGGRAVSDSQAWSPGVSDAIVFVGIVALFVVVFCHGASQRKRRDKEIAEKGYAEVSPRRAR